MEIEFQNKILPYEKIFSFQNLFLAWRYFQKGKKDKKDVAEFASDLIHNLSVLESSFLSDKYKHGGYAYFKISDPKTRDIHKASVSDRIVHHALYRAIYPYFDKYFIHDSYSCRLGKGAHRAIFRFEKFINKASRNNIKTVWVLKCDIRKCFASVDQEILKSILKKHIHCSRTMSVIESIIDSFSSGLKGKGIPLGNLTSQLFVNIYLNELDQFMKRRLHTRIYIRYADDFAILSQDKDSFAELVPIIESFIESKLKLSLHPKKVSIKTIASGVDFLGWVHFPNHRILRTSTKKKMYKVIRNNPSEAVKSSYNGLLSHGNTYKIRKYAGCWD